MRIARVYEHPAADEQRVLVDRLWPRGLTKSDERVGTWLPQVAPSSELRHWYGHDRERYEEFAQRYLDELERLVDPQLDMLRELSNSEHTVVVTAARDLRASHVPVLVGFLGADSTPAVIPEHPIDTLERWELFGGAWHVRKQVGPHLHIDLLRCDGGERVDSVVSDDPHLLDWIAERESDSRS